MKNTYVLTMPTPDRCKELGIKYEGMMTRFSQWLTGIAFGLAAVDSAIYFSVQEIHKDRVIVKTDSWPLIGEIMEQLDQYGWSMYKQADLGPVTVLTPQTWLTRANMDNLTK